MDPIAAAVIASWALDWGTIGVLLTTAALYLRGWLRLRLEQPDKYTDGRLLCFLAGLAAIAFALESPIDALGGLLLQAHMVQHLLLTMVAPPLLLLGQPVLPLLRGMPRWVFRDALGPFLSARELKQLGRVIVHPVVTGALFASSIVIWHLPSLYDLALQSPPWHEVEHACFFWSAILFWWPVVDVWPSHSVWPRWAMIPCLLFAGMVNMTLSAVLSFTTQPLYASYAAAPRVWEISAREDQAAAGGIMWVFGTLIMLIPAAVLGMQVLQPAQRRPSAPVLRVLNPRPQKPFDLLRIALFRYRHFRRIVQTAMLLLAVAVVLDGLRGPQVAAMNLAGTLPWTQWRGLSAIALLMVGNLFCLACPLTVPRDLARRFVTPRFRWPRWLRSKWIAVGLLIIYLWAYETFSLWESPAGTAWIIVGYFTAAFVIDMTFQGAVFCKYICPIGQFHFTQSLISPFQVSVRNPAACTSCTTHDCFPACELQLFQPAKASNFDCTFCLACVSACPAQNVGVLRALPSLKAPQRTDVSMLILVLVFGAFLNAAGMTAPVMMWMHHWHARLGSMLPVATAMSIAGLVVLPALFAKRLRKVAFVLIPVGFSMWLAHFSNHLFGLTMNLQLLLLDFGLLASLYLAWRNARSLAVLATVLYSAGVWIVLQPMQMI